MSFEPPIAPPKAHFSRALVRGLPLQVHLLQRLPGLVDTLPPHHLLQGAPAAPQRRGHLPDLGVELLLPTASLN